MEKDKAALVSAIITTYKRPVDILARAVKSALQQTYNNMQIIIVNDNPENKDSENQISTMLRSFQDDRIIYIKQDKNSGACKARNTGLLISNGEYIELLDDDDEWLPQKTEIQLTGFSSEKVGMVYSSFYNIKSGLPGELIVRGTHSGDLSEEMLWRNHLGGCSMSMIRRKVFDECGMFDEELKSSQDYDMWLRIAQKYEINCINKPLTRRYMQSESITTNFDNQIQGFYRFCENNKKLFEKNPKAYNYQLNCKVNKWVEQGHLKDAWILYKQAVKVRPVSRYNIIEPLKGLIKYLFVKEKN